MKESRINSIVKQNISPSDALQMLISSGRIRMAVVIPSENYNIIYASRSFISEAEITAEEISSQKHCIFNRVHSDDTDKLKAAFDKALHKENTVDVRMISEKSGAVKWLRCKVFPAEFAEPEGAAAIIIRNITAEVTFREELIIRNERYKIYEMTTPAVLFEYDPAEDRMTFSSNDGGEIKQTVINNYMEQFGKSPLVHPEDRDRFISALISACNTPVTANIEYRSMIIDGEYKWCRTYYSGVADEHGKVTAVFGRVQDISTEFAKTKELIRKAELDSLTGLYNRASFENHILSALENVREKEKILLAVADIDNFKYFNDNYGHRLGDEVLKIVSSVIEKYFPGETTGRFGGDEFMIFTAAADCDSICERLSRLVEELHITVGGREIPINMSIGVYITSDKTITYPQLFELADKAMYRAKKSGKNKICIEETEKQSVI